MKKNKIISALMAIVASFVFVGTTAFAANGVLSIDCATTEAVAVGDTFDVTVSITENPGIVNFDAAVTYDSNLVLTGVADAGLLKGNSTSTSYTLNPFSLYYDDSANPDNTSTGIVTTLTFKVADTAEAGKTYDISIKTNDIYNYDVDNVYFNTDSTSVTIAGNEPPAPTYTKYDVSESSDNNKGKEGSTDEFYSYGIKTTITPNDWTLNALDYKFTKDGGATYVRSADNADDTLVGWSTPFAGESVLTFAVNVVNIPNDVVVAGSFEYDWTDPAAE